MRKLDGASPKGVALEDVAYRLRLSEEAVLKFLKDHGIRYWVLDDGNHPFVIDSKALRSFLLRLEYLIHDDECTFNRIVHLNDHGVLLLQRPEVEP